MTVDQLPLAKEFIEQSWHKIKGSERISAMVSIILRMTENEPALRQAAYTFSNKRFGTSTLKQLQIDQLREIVEFIDETLQPDTAAVCEHDCAQCKKQTAQHWQQQIDKLKDQHSQWRGRCYWVMGGLMLIILLW